MTSARPAKPAPKPAPRRVAHQPSWLERMSQDHVRAIRATLAALLRRPVGTLLTAFVIGITLALPAGLHTMVANLGHAGESVQGSLRASLFLKDEVGADRGRELARELANRPGVSGAHYISREQALEEFRSYSGFGEALDILQDNPLPATIVVTPDAKQPQARVEALLNELGGLPEVAQAKLDQQWLQRLYAILALVQRAVLIIAAALALAVLIVVGNTIRLDIENRRDEIEVMKLIGAPGSYIRRPFLYTGLWYGLTGGILACLLVEAGVLSLVEPARRLAGLYDSQSALQGLSFDAGLAVFAAGLGLGWLGAFWSVSRHLRHIEPAT
ncbi:MAG: cell division protein FtsX [Nevskia sp.]|nr:cell division protein FtsX [Nevskia sp.]